MKKKVHVIHHTHWDFEWYFTNNESFIQLTYHMDEVLSALENNQIDYYLLDGQMSILDEYLQSCPEQKQRIRQLVLEKRLFIGPWYTQTDELIVSGESIIRNLNLGMDLADELGGSMKIGYLPDSFGQSKDMPKIYQGMGMHQTVFWRGVPNDVTNDREFFWESEDGSKVLASNIKNGYFVGVGLIYEDHYQELMNTIEAGAVSEHLVLPVGGDQRYIDFNLRERIETYNQELEDYQLVESTYDHFFDEIDQANLSTVSGEFISSSVSKIHRSIYSSRYDHKYLNDKVERRMIYQVEPLMVMAEKVGIPYKKGLLDRIWKLLAKNQAHDSAGGCNSDKTNKIILDRFIEADQLSYSLVDYLTRKLSESQVNVQEDDVTIFNPLPWAIKKVVSLELSSNQACIVLKENGKEIPTELVSTKKEYKGSIRRTISEMDEADSYYIHQIVAEVTLPAFSFKTFQVIAENQQSQIKNSADTTIENQLYRCTFDNGQLNLLIKSTNQQLKNALVIEDSGDEGDTYDYSPPYEDESYQLDFSEATVSVIKGQLQEQMKLTGFWYIAKDLTERRQKKRKQKIAYDFTISLNQEAKQLNCHLVIDNHALDHRMRVLLQTPFANDYSYTDTPFGTVRREAEDPHLHDWQELGWREEPTAIFPMLHYVNTHQTLGSFTAFSKGIKEYQLVGENFSQIALTLFRSVGFLGRPDLLRRPGVASGNEFKYIPTPDSQLQKKLTFKFALQWDQSYQPAKLAKDYLLYALTYPFYQIQEINRFTTTLKYFVSNPLPQPVKNPESIELISETVVLSSLRKAPTGKGVEIRVYNPSLTETVEGGVIKTNPSDYYFVNLRGVPISKPAKNGTIHLGEFKPGEIKTIRIV